MSHYKEHDRDYLAELSKDPNYDDPKWCAIQELEQRIAEIEKRGYTKPPKTPADNIKNPEKGKTLTYREKDGTEHDIANYTVKWGQDTHQLTFAAYDPIQWDSKPVKWLLDRLEETGYEAKSQGETGLTVYIPRGDKFGPVLGWAAWAFYAPTMEEPNNNAANKGTG